MVLCKFEIHTKVKLAQQDSTPLVGQAVVTFSFHLQVLSNLTTPLSTYLGT